MKTKFPFLLLAAVVLASPAVGLAQSAPKLLSETFRVERYAEPIFPAAFRNKNISEGYAQVQLLVAADGTLLESFISTYSHPEFANSVEYAVKGWTFRPAADPAAAPQRFNIRIDFRREGMLVVQGDFQEIVKSFLGQRESGPEVTLARLRDLDSTPEVVNLVVPEYPPALKARKVSGATAVSFFIDETGAVHVPSAFGSTDPAFGAAAVAAVKQWSFSPPQRKGAATRVLAVQEFTFTPDGVAPATTTPGR